MMTAEEFDEKYCRVCGSQRCGGILDEESGESIEGCAAYNKHFPYGENTTICGEDGCDGCFF